MDRHSREFVPVIRQARADQRNLALELVLSTRSVAERADWLSQWLSEPEWCESHSGLWIAEVDGQIAGAALGRTAAGRIATVWPAQLLGSTPEPVAGLLLQAVMEWLAASQAHWAQALLPVGTGCEHQQLINAGFTHIAELLFKVCPLAAGTAWRSARALSDELELMGYQPEMRSRLRQIVQRTYEGSLDCPAIGLGRDIDDVLDGYAAGGDGGTGGWYLAIHGGRDVGCLLVATDRRHEYAELVYMGVIPEARGRGWGSELVRQAKSVVRAVGLNRLALAVDAANRPAIDAYDAAGFYTWANRSVYFRHIDGC